MLQMRQNCEACDKDLAPGTSEAFICSFECTFCRDCTDARFNSVCPNCGGDLVRRPARAAELLDQHPASSARVVKTHA